MTKKYFSVKEIIFDEEIGYLQIYHNGNISWEVLQEIKNDYFGKDSVAIEVYPPEDRVVNTCPCRHLWKLGKGEFYPDIKEGKVGNTLAERLAYVRGKDDALQEVWKRLKDLYK